MKKTISLMATILVAAFTLHAQVPQTFTYQAVVRNAEGNLITNGDVGLRISILQGSENGAVVYIDQRTVRTNPQGLFSITIGGDGIDWANGPYYLESEIDPVGGNNYSINYVQQILSVPYALYAEVADSVAGGINVPTNVSQLVNDAGYQTSSEVYDIVNTLLNDSSSQTLPHEFQVLSISDDTIFLTNGGFVKLPPTFSGDYNDLTNKPDIPTVPTNVSAFTNDAGYLTSYTETQNLSNVLTIGNSAGNKKITNLATPVDSNDAVTKKYVDDAVASTSGNPNMKLYQVLSNGSDGNSAGNHSIRNLADPINQQDAVNLRSMNNAISDALDDFTAPTPTLSEVLSWGNSANGHKIANLAYPVYNSDAANKAYVDNVIWDLFEWCDSAISAINSGGGGAIPVPRAPTPFINESHDGRIIISIDVIDVDVRYTIDGSEPTEDSPLYTEPIRVPEGTVVKAVAMKNAYRSEVKTLKAHQQN